jgi:fructose-specific phosphotransferase system component IIB
MAKIVAITSCPTGIAHTFMAAESLQRGAEALGHTMKVETPYSAGLFLRSSAFLTGARNGSAIVLCHN